MITRIFLSRDYELWSRLIISLYILVDIWLLVFELVLNRPK